MSSNLNYKKNKQSKKKYEHNKRHTSPAKHRINTNPISNTNYNTNNSTNHTQLRKPNNKNNRKNTKHNTKHNSNKNIKKIDRRLENKKKNINPYCSDNKTPSRVISPLRIRVDEIGTLSAARIHSITTISSKLSPLDSRILLI